MKKLQFILFGIALLFPLSLQAEITREQSDTIVFEYIQEEVTGDYVLLRSDNPPGEDGRTTISWVNSAHRVESASVEYPCRAYCLYNPNIDAPRTVLFLFINREDGNLLALKNKQAFGMNPKDWTEIARSGAVNETTGYVVGYETCGMSFESRKAKGYIVISEDLKDTLAVYGLPEIFEFPEEAFSVPTSGLTIMLNMAFPEKFRYAFKIRFTYTRSSMEEVIALGIGEGCFYPDIYVLQETYRNCKPVIINSAIRMRTSPAELTGIKWKLTGFVTNGNTRLPEQDSDNSYWLQFKNDNTFTGKSSSNFIGGTYEINHQTSSFRITNLEGTEIYEHPDGRLFIESLMALRSFELREDTLNLYYSETDYLRLNACAAEIEPVLIGKGDIYNFEGFTIPNRVITSVEEWNELKAAMRDRVYGLDTFDETDIDFSAYQVIALFDEIRGSSGWSIDITGIVEYSDKIVVSVTNLKTGNATCVVTQPYHIVRIPASSKEIVFTISHDSSLPVADFNVPDGCSVNYAQMKHDSLYVINSVEEWATVFTCENNPQIDFSTKTLLVAFGGTTSGIADISRKLLFENNTYSLTVDITLNETTVAQGWHVVLITDKINAQSVALNLKKHYGDGSLACRWEQVTPIAPSDNQKSRLNYVFSDSNELMRNVEHDTLFVINNQKDMGQLQDSEYHDIWIDWDNYSVIGGKIIRPQGPNEILSQQLSKCSGTSSYKYEMEIKECTLCYDAEEHLYFWAIYAKADFKEVSLTVKTVE
jgi:hypothetical protein